MFLKKLKTIFLLTLLTLFIFSCKEENSSEITSIITSNVGINTFEQIADNQHFVLSQNKIRLLNTSNPINLSISSTLPFTEQYFESVKGNSDTLFIQTKESIDIYVLSKDSKVNWDKKASIEAILPCDKFVVLKNKLMISKGNKDCFRNSLLSELFIYSLKDITQPKILARLEIPSPLQLKRNNSTAFLLTSDASLNSILPLTDSTFSVNPIIKLVNAYDFDVFEKKLLLKSSTQINQYDISDLKNNKLLSTIAITK